MSAPHDTPEAVEAMAARCTSWYAAVAAMLRRLHARAVEAEAVADQAVWAMEEHKAALATARADALREVLGDVSPESASNCLTLTANDLRARGYEVSADLHARLAAAILALIEKEPRA